MTKCRLKLFLFKWLNTVYGMPQSGSEFKSWEGPVLGQASVRSTTSPETLGKTLWKTWGSQRRLGGGNCWGGGLASSHENLMSLEQKGKVSSLGCGHPTNCPKSSTDSALTCELPWIFVRAIFWPFSVAGDEKLICRCQNTIRQPLPTGNHLGTRKDNVECW